MSQAKRLLLIADDYGISSGVSRGIRELAAQGRLSGTGAMTLMEAWAKEAPALAGLGHPLAVGLHFTLTDQRPLGAMPRLAPKGRLPGVGALLVKSHAGLLDRDEIEAELHRQLDAFEAAMGRPPDFIDGHQHVHVLPTVRDAVLGLFPRRLDPATCWLRDCSEDPSALLARGHVAKAGLIAAIARPFRRLLGRRGLHANRGFAGFYDGSGQAIGDAFPRFLAHAGDTHLIMVHPGHVDEELVRLDSLTAPRQAELAFLGSDALPALLAAHGFALTLTPESWQTPAS